MMNQVGATSRSPLPKGWVWTKVGELYDIIGGGTPSTTMPEYWDGDIPWITSADIHGVRDIRPRKAITEKGIQESATNLVPKGSIIVVTRVGLGKVALTQTPICFSQDSQALVGSTSLVYSDYSLYYLSQAVQVFKHQHRGTTISGVTKKQLSELYYALPPLSEQHRIVAKIEELFTRLDAGVQALKKAKAQLKAYRQAVLKHAFEGKLTAQWREAHKGEMEPASALLERIKKERMENVAGRSNQPRRGDRPVAPTGDTPDLPVLPEGWVWTRVGELSGAMQYGYTAASISEPVGPKMLRITDIQDNRVDWDSVPHCKIKPEEKTKYILREGDLVFARTGATVGKSFLIKGKFPEAVFASYLIRVIISQHIAREFVYYFFQSNAYWSQIRGAQIGIGQPNVNSQVLSKLFLPLCPVPEQHKIVEEIDRRFSVADEIEKTVEQSLKQAERLRQSILKRAFEGELVPQDPTDEPAEKLLDRIRVGAIGRSPLPGVRSG